MKTTIFTVRDGRSTYNYHKSNIRTAEAMKPYFTRKIDDFRVDLLPEGDMPEGNGLNSTKNWFFQNFELPTTEKELRIHSSPMVRCQQTARYLCGQLAFHMNSDRALVERDAGLFYGLTHSQINENYPDYCKKIKAGKYDADYPEGESIESVKIHVQEFLDYLFDKEVKNYSKFLIISHGETLRVFEWILMGFEGETYNEYIARQKNSDRAMRFKNGEVNKYVLENLEFSSHEKIDL